jgi:hypothetical protein
MIIVSGTRFFGRADVVPGVGHVACRFVHVMFCPIVPIETVFLLDSEGGEKRSVRCRLLRRPATVCRRGGGGHGPGYGPQGGGPLR